VQGTHTFPFIDSGTFSENCFANDTECLGRHKYLLFVEHPGKQPISSQKVNNTNATGGNEMEPVEMESERLEQQDSCNTNGNQKLDAVDYSDSWFCSVAKVNEQIVLAP
jgi:hypothetical protein